jgi:hypothetical protein
MRLAILLLALIVSNAIFISSPNTQMYGDFLNSDTRSLMVIFMVVFFVMDLAEFCKKIFD